MTIKLFLTNGNPNGLKIAEISNWTGKAITCSRNELSELFSRDEINKPGVYCLTGIDANTGDPALYIGEAESISSRLKKHTDKDYWGQVTILISKDDNFTKAHIKYIEGQLIDRALKTGKALLQNSASSGAKLPESDIAEMNVYLDNAYQLLTILGIDFFISSASPANNDSDPLLFCKIKGLVAKGRRTSNGFLILKDSQAVAEDRPSAKEWFKSKKKKLIKTGILIKENDHYVFSKNTEFASPSTAGAIVRGGNTNGLKVWKTSDGVTLKALENKKIKI
ncbi:MAG: GIY-YIG nuclease family protein [Syntrophorhabdaceae bacterium]